MTIRLQAIVEDSIKEKKNHAAYLKRKQNRLKEAGKEEFRVSFDRVEIREYPMILGYNPAVSQGPPLEIGWEHQGVESWKFHVYEKTRPVPRTYLEMNVPLAVRIDILERSGVSKKSINIRARDVKVIRIKRIETQQNMYRTETHEKMEKAKRGLKNFFSDKKKKEKALLKKTEALGKLPKEGDEEDFDC